MHRIIYRMKLTAIIPDDLLAQVEALALGSTKTESVITALREWVSIKQLSQISQKVRQKPLKFSSSDIAAKNQIN